MVCPGEQIDDQNFLELRILLIMYQAVKNGAEIPQEFHCIYLARAQGMNQACQKDTPSHETVSNGRKGMRRRE